MASTVTMPPPLKPRRPAGPFKRWLLAGQIERIDAPHVQEGHRSHPWYQVMCLTGVDYFSTLGYQPGIAALAAGALSPLATLILVLLTLLGALPVYSSVAQESPHGEGSIGMLEHLLPWWLGKLFVLVLLGFVATDFIITITLSAADATAHVIENPFAPEFLHGQEVAITLVLVALLGVIFLKGFKEAIGIAVALVVVYLGLNAVVVAVGLFQLATHPAHLSNWQQALTAQYNNPLLMVGVALILFPRLALGLSGFETGVAVMPLIKGDPGDTEQRPAGRIRNTRKLLISAALIMSAFLLTSSLATTTLIPAAEFQAGGKASGRALAYLGHLYLGDIFGTVYDVSTIAILWFAGASAMAGLLNIVPRYLPRYGMAPEWTQAARPLVIVFITIAFAVTIIFQANVEAQGGAYATGVLVLITSATIAVTLSAWRRGSSRAAVFFGLIALIFAYTTVINSFERPDGIRIAGFFIAAIIVVSLLSRLWRTLELRVNHIELDATAQRFVASCRRQAPALRILPNHPDSRDVKEYSREIRQARIDHELPPDDPLIFLEVYVQDSSEFAGVLKVCGYEVGGYRVFRCESTAIPNAIAAMLLYLRDTTGKRPHAYFNWTEGNPLLYLIAYTFSGQGDIAPLTHEILRRAERDPDKRPIIHVAG